MNEAFITNIKPIKAVNWNSPDDSYSSDFLDQNFIQIWTEKEIPLSDDKMSWLALTDDERETYMRVLGGLTFLDTLQGTEGMPLIMQYVPSNQKKAVLGIMGFMEHIHARSYSSIFTTVATKEEIDAVFLWAEENPYLQKKGAIIAECYRNIDSPKALYKAMYASVLLESELFYSGFFYPLILSGGRNLMVASAEVISLIIRDEAVHGQYVGTIARELFATLTPQEQQELLKEVEELFWLLYENEVAYTKDLYSRLGMVDEVIEFLKYNANRAMMNLGHEPKFEGVEINPIVMNGINTTTKHHDFFSKKGNGYQKSVNIVAISDEDFYFGDEWTDLITT